MKYSIWELGNNKCPISTLCDISYEGGHEKTFPSFSYYPCSSSFKLFDAVLSIFKTINFNLSENV